MAGAAESSGKPRDTEPEPSLPTPDTATGASLSLTLSGIRDRAAASFESIAKATLVVSAVLFVADPLPPYTRLAALVSCFSVLKLSAAHKQLLIRRQHEEEQAGLEFLVGAQKPVAEPGMAPRTRTRQRVGRRKWMRDQHQRLSDETVLALTKSGEEPEPPPAAAAGGADRPRDGGAWHSRNTEVPRGGGGKGPAGDNRGTHPDPREPHLQHPPGCLCFLLKQSRGRNFFLPPSMVAPGDHDGDDTANYCVQASDQRAK
ncbi:unnamed protein product [Pseudo-nitzschia multistriata]|uniref:Uncharacterized protein n=1 Tax=Pseudo-nitzschia multistriata TaxID=183589 RepID=A0A448YXW4_9STRA|nr:unnamed protein product [Pseudo-nitzschia multistriata]